jgi:hypothetical protein
MKTTLSALVAGGRLQKPPNESERSILPRTCTVEYEAGRLIFKAMNGHNASEVRAGKITLEPADDSTTLRIDNQASGAGRNQWGILLKLPWTLKSAFFSFFFLLFVFGD